MTHRHLVTAATLLVLAACDAGLSEPEDGIAPLAVIYLGNALDVMEFNSLKRFEIDWVPFRAEAVADAAGATNPFETYPAIEAALVRIGDNHSFFRPAIAFGVVPSGATTVSSWAPGGESTTQPVGPATAEPSGHLLVDGVGYVDVPEFQGGGQDGNELATDYHRIIEGVDTLGALCRWVVDLRGNRGGNMWPMVAGLGPIMGEGAIGAFVYPDSVSTPWFYETGRAGVDGVAFTTAHEPYTLESPLPFVAVLTDSLTASSGEAVAVAFRGRERARSFGTATWGVSTANSAFPLSDGAVIFLTVATLADRLGTVYGGELEPDEPLTGGTKTGDPETDLVLDAAITWLQAQPCG